MRTLTSLAFLFFFTVNLLQGQGAHFTHLDGRNGLSQNTVTKVLRDNEGLFWFGTQDGLNLYDGYSFVVFRHSLSDTNSLTDNYILDLVDDGHNRIWIGTRNGLCYYNKLSGTVHRFKLNTPRKYETYNEVKLLKCEGDTLRFQAGSTGPRSILTKTATPVLLNTSANNIQPYIIGRTKNGYYKLEAGKVCFTPTTVGKQAITLDSIRKLHSLQIYREELYLVDGDQILVYSERSSYNQPIRRLQFTAPVSDFCIDACGLLWVGCSQGLVSMNLQTEQTRFYNHHPLDPFSIPKGEVLNVTITADHVLWAGFNGEGVVALHLDAVPFATFSPLYHESILNNSCWSFCATSNGIILPGENGFGWIPNKPGNTPPHWLTQLRGINFPTVCMFNGNVLYIGTRGAGLFSFDTLTLNLQQKHLQGKFPYVNTVTYLMKSRNGRLWVSTHDACFESDSAMNRFTMRYDGYVLHTMEDSNRKIWIATTNGLVKFDPLSGTIKEYMHDNNDPETISSRFCSFTLEDGSGKMWVATLGGGLNVFDPIHEKFSAITTEQGLPNNVVYALSSDSQGNIWMSTNKGVAIYNTDNTIRNYSVLDGLNADEFVSGSVFSDPEGNIWFGSVQGPVRFNPKSTASNSVIALPVLTSFLVNDRFYTRDADKSISLAPDQRNIRFTFSACDIAHQHHYAFSYQLEGFDKEWRPYLPGKQEINYTNLPFGEYKIRLRAYYNGNPADFKEQIIQVSIAPYLWETAWFQIVAVLIVGGLIIYITRYFIRSRFRKRIEQMEMQQKINSERERISRELHDNVGSQLTYLVSTLDYLSYRLDIDHADKYQELVQELSVNTRATNAQLRETIWALHQQSISIENFADKCRQHLTTVLNERSGISYSLKTEFSDPEFRLNPMQAIHLFRIVQEAVNNTIKYAKAAKLTVSITLKNTLTLNIEDDGAGFDPEVLQGEHYGLQNIQNRAQEISGKAKIISSPGNGCRIEIEVPLK